MTKARGSKGKLLKPAVVNNISDSTRKKWLAKAQQNFASKSHSNKRYYSAILEILWPAGHGLPGPHIRQQEVRDAINATRPAKGPYMDIFRRLRELQGEEGFHCIIKEGIRYQLISREIASKREPRAKPSASLWAAIKDRHGQRCSHCGASDPEAKLSPDHRVPRSRSGTNDEDNWQALCEQCNNQKSSACQNCSLNCQTCPWAYPETYKQIIIDDNNKEDIRRIAADRKVQQSAIANEIIRKYFQTVKK